MSLNVAVQMDPIERINIRGDSTFALLLEAQARGHAIAYYTPDRLALRGGKVFATVQPLKVRDEAGDHFTLGTPSRTELASFDVVLLRQDPPFDLAYITTTHLLERIHPATLVVNDPAQVRNAPEKMFVMEFPDLMPPTLITRDLAEIKAFRVEHGDIVMKPLYGKGGEAVFRLAKEDLNFGSLYDLFTVTFREQWVVQKFLPAVKDGDKRIILVDGEFAGAVNRVPAPDDLRSNMVRGGTPEGDRPDRARARDLRPHRAVPARARAHLRRHRRDRRPSDRDQRHLADRHPRHQEPRRPGRGGHDLGQDRGEAAPMRRQALSLHRPFPFQRMPVPLCVIGASRVGALQELEQQIRPAHLPFARHRTGGGTARGPCRRRQAAERVPPQTPRARDRHRHRTPPSRSHRFPARTRNC